MAFPEIGVFVAILRSPNEGSNANIPRIYNNLSEHAFSLSDALFIRNFRLNKELVRYLSQILTPYMVSRRRRSGLDIQSMVLIALNFFATGSYQMPVANTPFFPS